MNNGSHIEETVPFTSGDGRIGSLVHVHGGEEAPKGPILLVHGAGVRANIFRAPVETTIVDALIADGYDVWLENWRASIEGAPNQWTLDQAAAYDHPRAAALIAARTGWPTLKAIIHCQGSTSFMMSLVAGLLPSVTTVISNAVSLHPVVPDGSRCKLTWALPGISDLTDYLNPHWGVKQEGLFSRLLSTGVDLTHRECSSTVCRLVSFVYGSGHPALWRHENLNAATHDAWIDREFAWVPVSFFAQMARCVAAGHLITVDGIEGLPADLVAQPPRSAARCVLYAGEQNLCFLPESQQRTFAYLDRLRPGYHGLRIIPGYGHLDMFMGFNASRDVFPSMLADLDASN